MSIVRSLCFYKRGAAVVGVHLLHISPIMYCTLSITVCNGFSVRIVFQGTAIYVYVAFYYCAESRSFSKALATRNGHHSFFKLHDHIQS